MHDAASPSDDGGRASRNPISVALLAAVACVPIVIAAGFLTDRPGKGQGAAAAPADVSILALRGGIETGTDRHAPTPMRAGF